MAIKSIHTYLVHPNKNIKANNAAKISGSEVPLKGKTFNMMNGIFQNAEADCKIDIAFRSAEDGSQNNSFRDLLIQYIDKPTIENGKLIAERLGEFTTKRSHLGLLFLMLGTHGLERKVVISRFPADNGIMAEEDGTGITIEFIERIFMKSAKSYKSAVYTGVSLKEFWSGKAIDKQISNPEINLSDYWIFDFLESDFKTTSAAGSRRFALALRAAETTSDNIEIKSEIASLATLAGNLKDENTTIKKLLTRFNASKNTQKLVIGQLSDSKIAKEQFKFNSSEFKTQIPYRHVELDNGALLTSRLEDFDEVFNRESLPNTKDKFRYVTEGIVVDDRMRKTR